MLQHDATGTDADLRRLRQEVRDQGFRRGAREAGYVMVLRDPEAMVAPLLRLHGKVGRRMQGVCRCASGIDGTLVEKAEQIGHGF
ncbi:hypothetical protein D9M68_730380 [compost metagenome]